MSLSYSLHVYDQVSVVLMITYKIYYYGIQSNFYKNWHTSPADL